jgi:hypothetical protein
MRFKIDANNMLSYLHPWLDGNYIIFGPHMSFVYTNSWKCSRYASSPRI